MMKSEAGKSKAVKTKARHEAGHLEARREAQREGL